MKIGDVVQLKSGGPKMTVEAISPMGAKVVWFDTLNSLHRDTVEEKLLMVLLGGGIA